MTEETPGSGPNDDHDAVDGTVGNGSVVDDVDDRRPIGADDEAETRPGDGRVPIDLGRRPDDGRSAAPDDEGFDDRPIGPEPSSTPVESGSPTLEGTLFVVLGALSMIAVLVRMISFAV